MHFSTSCHMNSSFLLTNPQLICTLGILCHITLFSFSTEHLLSSDITTYLSVCLSISQPCSPKKNKSLRGGGIFLGLIHCRISSAQKDPAHRKHTLHSSIKDRLRQIILTDEGKCHARGEQRALWEHRRGAAHLTCEKTSWKRQYLI